jgi:ATP-dependent DNA helicase RecG
MSSAYDKLGRILNLEKEQGFRDRAVIGGLKRFLGYWEKEARREACHSMPPIAVDEVVRAMNAYGEINPQSRRSIVEELLRSLANAPHQTSEQPAQEMQNGPTGQVPASTKDSDDSHPPANRQRSLRPPLNLPDQKRVRRVAENQISLSDSVTALKGVSTVNEDRLARLEISTIRDLIYHFPRRYDDYGQLKTINRLVLGDEVTIAGVIRETKARTMRGGAPVVSTVITDGTGAIEARWFGQPYLAERLKAGREIVISGKVGEYLGRLCFDGPEWEPLQRVLLHTARLVPVYALTEGIKGRWLRRLMRATLDYWVPRIIDPVPQAILQEEGLLDLGTALEQMHFPSSQEMLAKARQRLCFDEFLLLQLGILRHRQAWRAQVGRALPIPQETCRRSFQAFLLPSQTPSSAPLRRFCTIWSRTRPWAACCRGMLVPARRWWLWPLF